MAQWDVLSAEEMKTTLDDLKEKDHWFCPLFSVWLSTGLLNVDFNAMNVRWASIEGLGIFQPQGLAFVTARNHRRGRCTEEVFFQANHGRNSNA
jgi:hypothetical protein